MLLLSGLCSFFRNKDGFLTMGEIKLVNKNATKNEIKVISQYRYNPKSGRDGCLKTCSWRNMFLAMVITHDICPQETIQEYDFDKDGKLNTAEYHQV